jgi:hypothetical protein
MESGGRILNDGSIKKNKAKYNKATRNFMNKKIYLVRTKKNK